MLYFDNKYCEHLCTNVCVVKSLYIFITQTNTLCTSIVYMVNMYIYRNGFNYVENKGSQLISFLTCSFIMFIIGCVLHTYFITNYINDTCMCSDKVLL